MYREFRIFEKLEWLYIWLTLNNVSLPIIIYDIRNEISILEIICSNNVKAVFCIRKPNIRSFLHLYFFICLDLYNKTRTHIICNIYSKSVFGNLSSYNTRTVMIHRNRLQILNAKSPAPSLCRTRIIRMEFINIMNIIYTRRIHIVRLPYEYNTIVSYILQIFTYFCHLYQHYSLFYP